MPELFFILFLPRNILLRDIYKYKKFINKFYIVILLMIPNVDKSDIVFKYSFISE